MRERERGKRGEEGEGCVGYWWGMWLGGGERGGLVLEVESWEGFFFVLFDHSLPTGFIFIFILFSFRRSCLYVDKKGV